MPGQHKQIPCTCPRCNGRWVDARTARAHRERFADQDDSDAYGGESPTLADCSSPLGDHEAPGSSFWPQEDEHSEEEELEEEDSEEEDSVTDSEEEDSGEDVSEEEEEDSEEGGDLQADEMIAGPPAHDGVAEVG